MTDEHGIKKILDDLRERKVFRSAIAYSVAAWIVVQAASIALPAYNAPPWTMRALITAVVLGLPLAVFLAWLYDITPAGLVRRPADALRHRWSSRGRFGVATFATLVTGGTIWWLWSGYVDPAAQRIGRGAPPAQPVVAVPSLTNLSGDSSLDWLGEGLANLVRDGLAESPHLVVVSPLRWRSILRVAGKQDAVPEAAARAGIDYLVSGEILLVPDGLLLTARVTDVTQGIEMQAQSFPGRTAQDLLGAAERLVQLTKQGLKVPHTEHIDWFAADFAVGNMAAYEAYLSGLKFFLDFRYADAERAFRAALHLAPGYHVARYRLAQVQAAVGQTQAAIETLDGIPKDAATTQRERAYFEGARALFARDADRATATFKGVLQQYPYDVEARLLLAQAYDLGYDDEAALAELTTLAQQEPENERIWSFIAETSVRAGRYDEARVALDRYLELMPEDPFGFTILGQVALLSGSLDSAVEHLQHALALDADFPRARFALAQTRALRGELSDAEKLLRELAADTRAPPADRIDAAFDLTSMLRASGRFDEALLPLQVLEDPIHQEQIREAMALAERGQIHIELSHFDVARKLIDSAFEHSPGVPTRYLFARGRLELAQGRGRDVAATSAEIRSHALPADDPDRTEDKAAAYLDGMAALLEGRTDEAIRHLRTASALDGYHYAIYELDLARALLQAGQRDEALRIAHAAATKRDPTEVRLDLELDRVRALLLEASIRAERGDLAGSAQLARSVLARWRDAPSSREEVKVARRLAGSGTPPSG